MNEFSPPIRELGVDLDPQSHPDAPAMPRSAAPLPPAGAKQDFIDALLAALTGMAALSPRRQADVAVAMRRASLSATPDEVQAALAELRREGCIEPPLLLSDGGILVSVTARGIERLSATAHRHVVDAMLLPRDG